MLPSARDGTQHQPPSGYTIIELVVVLMIAAVLLSYGLLSLNRASADRGAAGARDTYVWLARRSRALAVQRGTDVKLSLKVSTQRAKLLLGTTTVDQVYFYDQYAAKPSLSSGNDSLVICYTPRGIASGSCSIPSGSTVPVTTVTFTRGGRTASAVVQALGQVEAK